ncbi:MAG: hypothetical protein CM15mP84_04340 [Cellvibrionales bacterium]|nr:MAG: hypothetical protein CM15mP84_04340 [Cellvibrionales bacterium]
MASNGLPARLKRPSTFGGHRSRRIYGDYRMFNLQDPRLMATSLGQSVEGKYGESITKGEMEQGPIEVGNLTPFSSSS